MENKICSRCRASKQLQEYYRNKSYKNGRYSICIECCKKISRDLYRSDPNKLKARRDKSHIKHPTSRANTLMKHKYGITFDEFEKMLKKQNGVCGICGLPETRKHQSGTLKKLSIDHDHKTKIVRGLLCSACNHAIGLLKENVKIIENAALYLRAFL